MGVLVDAGLVGGCGVACMCMLLVPGEGEEGGGIVLGKRMGAAWAAATAAAAEPLAA